MLVISCHRLPRPASGDRVLPRRAALRARRNAVRTWAMPLWQTASMDAQPVRHPVHHSTSTSQDAQPPVWIGIVPEDSVAPAKRGGVQRTQTWNEGTRHRTTSHDRTNRAPQAWAGPAQAHAHESQRATRIISRAPTRACLGAG